MFKEMIIESIQLVDKGCVTLVYSTNQRQVFEVKNNNKTYHCFKHTYFCSCLSFAHNGKVLKI